MLIKCVRVVKFCTVWPIGLSGTVQVNLSPNKPSKVTKSIDNQSMYINVESWKIGKLLLLNHTMENKIIYLSSQYFKQIKIIIINTLLYNCIYTFYKSLAHRRRK